MPENKVYAPCPKCGADGDENFKVEVSRYQGQTDKNRELRSMRVVICKKCKDERSAQ